DVPAGIAIITASAAPVESPSPPHRCRCHPRTHHRMFIGHFGLAFAAKRAAPRTSLGTMFVAAQLADLFWPIFLLAGVEQVRIAHASPNPFLTLDFVSYPWSHSLLTQLAAGAAFGALYFVITRYAAGAIVVGLLVPSHWVLDLLVHVPDLPLLPGGAARFGF